MPNYLSPGVYMEEVSSGPRPIEAVGTAVAAFVGYTVKAQEERDGETHDLTGKPILVTNWSQYVAKFGEFHKDAYMPDSVYGYFQNGGGRAYIISVKTMAGSADPDLAEPATVSVPSAGNSRTTLTFKAKEGGPIGNNLSVKVSAIQPPALESGKDDDSDDDSKSSKSSSSSKKDTPTPTHFKLEIEQGGEVVEAYDSLTLDEGAKENVVEVLQKQSKLVFVEVKGKTDVVPSDGTYELDGGEMKTKEVTVKDYQGDTAERTGLSGLEAIDDVTMIAVPDLMMSYEKGEIDLMGIKSIQSRIVDYCELVRYCYAILDAPPRLTPQQVKEWRNSLPFDTSRAAMYYPWIQIADVTGEGGRTRSVPPSGHIACMFARVDNERGVHKAPANEVLRGALDLDMHVTKGEHDMLNPINVNVIRTFPGRGIRVWGARNLTSDPEWRYVNVRRLFNMIEESIERGTQWVVFEPNDANLWARITRDVTSFLKLVWRTGALFGTTPEQAFYVKCDAETNPPEVRDAGQLVVEIGISPVKPAEFVIFRVKQWAGPDAE